MSETETPINAAAGEGWVANENRGIGRCRSVLDLVTVEPLCDGGRLLRLSLGESAPIELRLDRAGAQTMARLLGAGGGDVAGPGKPIKPAPTA